MHFEEHTHVPQFLVPQSTWQSRNGNQGRPNLQFKIRVSEKCDIRDGMVEPRKAEALQVTKLHVMRCCATRIIAAARSGRVAQRRSCQ